MPRARPEVLVFRCTTVEQAMVVTAARAHGMNVNQFLHGLVMPEVRKQLEALATAEDLNGLRRSAA